MCKVIKLLALKHKVLAVITVKVLGNAIPVAGERPSGEGRNGRRSEEEGV